MLALLAHSTTAAILEACDLEPRISLSPYIIGSHWDGKRVDFAVDLTAALLGSRPVYDPAVQHHYEGTGAASRATPTAFASRAVPVSAPPPSPRRHHGGSCAGLGGLHTICFGFGTAMCIVHSQGASTGFRVCLFACLLIFRELSLPLPLWLTFGRVWPFLSAGFFGDVCQIF